MKRLLLPVLPILLFALGFSSCSEDFKVDAPYKPVTVVYGLLNVDSTRNYIRVQKAFLDESKSALDIAKVYDSSNYAALEVHLKELNNGTVINDEALTRVDLALEGYPKDTGAFFNTPNYAYKTTRTLNPAYRYRLVINNSATGERDSAETPVVSGFMITILQPTTTPQGGISFADNPPSAHQPFVARFSTGDSTRFFEGVIRFHYVDKNIVSGQQADHSFDWKFATYVRDGSSSSGNMSVPQSSFYPILASNIGKAPANTERYLDSCDVFLYAGSGDLYTYLLANNAQGGLTGDQVRPSYTNIRGTGVLGMFASRSIKVLHNVAIDQPTITALQANMLTQDLNIKGRSDH